MWTFLIFSVFVVSQTFSFEILPDSSSHYASALLRTRRSPGGMAMGHNGPPQMCCGKTEPKFPELPSECESLKEMMSDGKDDKMKRVVGFMCISECREKALGVFDGEKMDKDLVLASIKDIHQGDWAVKIATEKYDSCEKEAAKMKTDLLSKFPETKCDGLPFSLRACLHKEIELGCPKDEIVESEQCNHFREMLTKHA